MFCISKIVHTGKCFGLKQWRLLYKQFLILWLGEGGEISSWCYFGRGLDRLLWWNSPRRGGGVVVNFMPKSCSVTCGRPLVHIVLQKSMVWEYNSHERAYNAFIWTCWTGSTSTSERSTGNRPASKTLSWQYGLFCVNSAIMSAALHRKLPWAEFKHGRNMQNPPILWKSKPKLNISTYEKVWSKQSEKDKIPLESCKKGTVQYVSVTLFSEKKCLECWTNYRNVNWFCSLPQTDQEMLCPMFAFSLAFVQFGGVRWCSG